MSDRLGRIVAAWEKATEVDARSLGAARVFFGVYLMALLWPTYAWIADLPSAFFRPPAFSVVSVLEGFPGAGFFAGLDLVVALSTVTLTIGWFTRTSSFVLVAAMLAGDHFAYSFGKIDHPILLHVSLLAMAWAGWGCSFSVDAWRAPRARDRTAGETVSLSVLGICVAFGFFSAGFGKALNWIDFDLSMNGFASWLYGGYYTLGRQALLAPVAAALRPVWLWEVADIVAVVFELSAFAALLRKRWWLGWLVAACVFHLVNALVLNIPFLPHVPVYLCFIDWVRVWPALTSWVARWEPVAGAACVSIGLLVIRQSSAGPRGSAWEVLTGLERWDTGTLWIALVVWAGAAMLMSAAFLHEQRSKTSTHP
ncbi:MAG: hypothetical protein AAF752_09460 [Bacteroidota bacterium]